jgi:late competence protein required for DNA uptake (superfamily II DNA/RNA helicase)
MLASPAALDVLVCTTIIESGLDIPNANTIIIDRADALRARPALPAPRARRPLKRARLRLPARPAAPGG